MNLKKNEIIKVSIILPVYNSEKWLKRCLNSLINQTLKEIEIIIVDDGSTDSSIEIIKEYVQKDNRIKPYFFEKNCGVSMARNKAISMAIGEFIGFCDSDDYVDINFFNELYSQSGKYDVIHGIRLIDGKHTKKNPWGCIVPSIIRKSLLDKDPNLRFPIKLKRCEDSKFKKWLNNTTDNQLYCENNKSFYHYEKREGSLSNYIITK